MTGHVLIVFGGGLEDVWMAGDFSGLYKFFASDTHNAVAAFTVVDIGAFVNASQPLLFGDTRLSLGRHVVYRQAEPQFWQLIAPGSMKHAIFFWCKQTAFGCLPGDKITLIFICHGANTMIELGPNNQQQETLDVAELKPKIDAFPPYVHVNVINAACASGNWIAPLNQSATAAGRVSSTVHCSSHPGKDNAYALRSTSGNYRCGIFPVTVVDSLKENTSLFLHNIDTDRSSNVFDSEMHPLLDVIPHTAWSSSTNETYTGSTFSFMVPQGISGLISSVATNFLSFLAPYASAKTRYPPGLRVVKDAVEKQTALSATETGVYNLGRRYLESKLSAFEVRIFEEILNKRRQIQLEVFFFVKEGMARGVFSNAFLENDICWNSLSPKSVHNYNIFRKLFPKLQDTFRIQTKPQLVRETFNEPFDYLAIVISSSLMFANEYSVEAISNIGKYVGWSAAPEVVGQQFLKANYIGSQAVDISTFGNNNPHCSSFCLFDRLLPITTKEWNDLSAHWMEAQNPLLL